MTSISVLVIGGGGSGPGVTSPGGGGGGGGLAYANNITVVPGTTYNLFVGSGGASSGGGLPGNPGTASWFNTSAYLFANGGAGGNAGPGNTSGGGGGAAGYAAAGGGGGGAGGVGAGAGGTAGGTAATASFSGGAGGLGASGNQSTAAAAAVTGGAGAGGSGGQTSNGKGGGGVSFLGQSSVDASGVTTTPGTSTVAAGVGAATNNGGSGGTSPTDPNGGLYGGGSASNGSGAQGVVRIIWSTSRSYPTTGTGNLAALDNQGVGNIAATSNVITLPIPSTIPNATMIGRNITVASGTGSYPANTTVLSANATTIVTSAAPAANLSSAALQISSARTATTTAPTNPRENLFYLRMAPGLRYSLSTEQGVRPTPTPFIANANSAIVTTTLRGSVATTPQVLAGNPGGAYIGVSGFTGYRLTAANGLLVQPGLVLTAATTASGTSVLSNTATVAFVTYLSDGAGVYVFFPGFPISNWASGYTMTLTYPNSTTISNAVTPSTTIDTYNRFLLAPGMRYSLSTEQGYRPTSPTVTDTVSTTDGLFSNVYLQNGFFIYASQSGNVLSIQGNATGSLLQFGGSTIGTTYTQTFGGILKTGKTIYGPGGATATIVNQRFGNPANYDVTLTSPAYSYTTTTLTLSSVTGMYLGSPIRFTAAVTNTNLTANTIYYVTSITGTTITLTTTSPGNGNITVAAGSGSGTLAGNAYYGTINQGQPEGAAQDATTSVYATYMVNTSQTVASSIWFVPSDASFSNRPTNSRDSLNTFLMAPGLRYSLAKEQGEGDLHNNLASAATARGVLTNPALTAYQATNIQAWTSSTYNTLPYSYRMKELISLGEAARDVRLTVDNGKITASYVSAAGSIVSMVGTVSSGILTLYDTSTATTATNNSYFWNGADGGFRRGGVSTNTTSCLEMWIYPTVAGTALWSSGQGGSQFYHYVSTNANGSISLAYGSGSWAVAGTDTIASAGSVTTNAWNHVAFIGNGSTVTCMVNGVFKGSSSNVRGPSNFFYIGSYFNNFNNDGSFFRGYMKDVRYVSGSQVYSTGGFSTPIAPLASISGTLFLTLQSSSDLADLSSYGTVPTISTQSPYNSNIIGYALPNAILPGTVLSGSSLIVGTSIASQLSSATYTVSPSQTNLTATSMTYTQADSIQANYTNRPQTARDNLWTFQMAPGLRYSLSTEQGKIPTQPSNLRLVQDSFNPLVFKWGYGTKGGSMQDPSFKKKPPIQFWN